MQGRCPLWSALRMKVSFDRPQISLDTEMEEICQFFIYFSPPPRRGLGVICHFQPWMVFSPPPPPPLPAANISVRDQTENKYLGVLTNANTHAPTIKGRHTCLCQTKIRVLVLFHPLSLHCWGSCSCRPSLPSGSSQGDGLPLCCLVSSVSVPQSTLWQCPCLIMLFQPSISYIKYF